MIVLGLKHLRVGSGKYSTLEEVDTSTSPGLLLAPGTGLCEIFEGWVVGVEVEVVEELCGANDKAQLFGGHSGSKISGDVAREGYRRSEA